ncbi:MAG: peptidylprolyl isomerase [Patescibacteria group bacterium]
MNRIKLGAIILFCFAFVYGCTPQTQEDNKSVPTEPIARFGATPTAVETQPTDTTSQNTNETTMEEPTTPKAPTATSADDVKYSQATVNTNMGSFTVSFYSELSPKTVQNFQNLAESGFYDGVKFHRIIKGFMIQAGDPQSKDDSLQARWGTGGPGYTFADEFNDRKIVQGSLAMANAGPNTNGSQFFIVTAASTPHLDGVHTNFGEVTEGMDVIMAIEAVATEGPDRPVDPVVIESIELQ